MLAEMQNLEIQLCASDRNLPRKQTQVANECYSSSEHS